MVVERKKKSIDREGGGTKKLLVKLCRCEVALVKGCRQTSVAVRSWQYEFKGRINEVA